MSLIFTPPHFNICNIFNSKFLKTPTLNPNFKLSHCRIPCIYPCFRPKLFTILQNDPSQALSLTCCRDGINPSFNFSEEETTIDFDFGDEEDTGSPWEGAIVYRRNPSITHLEYCTTLERLGLGKLSTEISKSRASEMGLRVTKAVKDYPFGTPVQISMDVTRKKKKLRLDGIIKTVISLGCNRCGEPAAECIFSNFSLLLTEEPIDESDVINMGVIFGEDKFKTSSGYSGEEEDDEASIDMDDQLFFPAEEREIDISKHMRDMVHLEITINAICDSRCKGLCLKCGTNLNTGSCNCTNQEVQEKSYGPLGSLRKQMQQKIQ